MSRQAKTTQSSGFRHLPIAGKGGRMEGMGIAHNRRLLFVLLTGDPDPISPTSVLSFPFVSITTPPHSTPPPYSPPHRHASAHPPAHPDASPGACRNCIPCVHRCCRVSAGVSLFVWRTAHPRSCMRRKGWGSRRPRSG